MHRLDSRLTSVKRGSPLAGPAKALHRAGVRTTYRMHDKMLSNRRSRRLFAGSAPQLSPVQQEIVASLQSEGLAVVPFTSLFPESLWQELKSDADTFTKQVEEELELERTGKKKTKAARKDYVRRRLGKAAEIDVDDPWLQLALSPAMLDIANSYFGFWAKLVYSDQWYTVPMEDGAERTASQRWHRDYADRYLLKVFTYLSDVDGSAGPFEYVPGSTLHGPYAAEVAWEPLGRTYPADEEFRRRIPESAVRTLTGPAGTMIFCNTSGFHRGGFATEKPRLLWLHTYVSPASLAALSKRGFSAHPSSRLRDLPEPAQFALR